MDKLTVRMVVVIHGTAVLHLHGMHARVIERSRRMGVEGPAGCRLCAAVVTGVVFVQVRRGAHGRRCGHFALVVKDPFAEEMVFLLSDGSGRCCASGRQSIAYGPANSTQQPVLAGRVRIVVVPVFGPEISIESNR